ncbi:hypothetical protein [Methanopyrus sp.]
MLVAWKSPKVLGITVVTVDVLVKAGIGAPVVPAEVPWRGERDLVAFRVDRTAHDAPHVPYRGLKAARPCRFRGTFALVYRCKERLRGRVSGKNGVWRRITDEQGPVGL